jgi:hypothetical protein
VRLIVTPCSPEAHPPVSATPSQLQCVRPGGNLPTTFAMGFAVRQVYSFTCERVLVAGAVVERPCTLYQHCVRLRRRGSLAVHTVSLRLTLAVTTIRHVWLRKRCMHGHASDLPKVDITSGVETSDCSKVASSPIHFDVGEVIPTCTFWPEVP